MKELQAWFVRQARRESQVPCLEDALLGNRFGAYAWYRLRFFFLRYLASVLVHAVRVLFLFHLFTTRTFLALLLAHALVSLTGSFWWGALEVMRARVRRLFRAGRPHLIPGEIGRWLTLALALGGLTLALALGWFVWAVGVDAAALTPSRLYALTLALRLGVEFPIRALHSGVYAVRRIYRPVWAILAVESVSLIAVLALLPSLGAWSLPIGGLLSAMFVGLLVTHYTLRSYRFYGFLPLKLARPRGPRLGALGPMGEFFSAGASYALMKMDSVLALALFTAGAAAATDRSVGLFALFVAIGPTVQAGFDWAQLFYFDLKRLELRLFKNLRRRYERSVLRLSWLLAVLFWALACATGTLVFQRSLGDLYWLLAPFFVSRALLACVQIQAFSHRRYAELLGASSVWLVGFVAVAALLGDNRQKLLMLSLVTFGVFLWLRHRKEGLGWDEGLGEPVGLAEWLGEVGAVQEPVRIRALRLSPARPLDELNNGDRRWADRQVAERIARKLGRTNSVTLAGPGRIAWFERAGDAELPPAWLMAASGGLADDIGHTPVVADGRAALAEARRLRMLGRDVAAVREPRAPVRADEVARSFAAIFPRGVSYAPDQSNAPFFDTLTSREKRTIMADAIRFCKGARRGRRSLFDVSAFCVAGELRLIFVVDRRSNRRARSRWKETIRQLNLQAALTP